MVNSIHNNPGATNGVRELSRSSSVLEKIQERAATGKKVNSPKDDAAIFAIAQQLESQLAAAAAVKTNLAFGESVTGTALAAGQEVSDLLIEAKAKAVQASQDGLDQASRDALQADLNSLTAQIDTVVSSASFGGKNLLEQGGTGLNVQASENGDTIAVQSADLSSAGLGVDSLSLGTAADAQTAVGSIDSALKNTDRALANLGSSANRIDEQSKFTTVLSDATKQGLGNMVDADMGAEAAKLLATEVKLRLGVQSLSIANAAPRNIASLFE